MYNLHIFTCFDYIYYIFYIYNIHSKIGIIYGTHSILYGVSADSSVVYLENIKCILGYVYLYTFSISNNGHVLVV